MDRFIQFIINLLANLLALTIYGIVTYALWKAIW